MMDSKDDICCIHCCIVKVDGDDLQLVGQHRKDALTALEARAATLDLHALLERNCIRNVAEIYIMRLESDQVPLMMPTLD